MVHASFDFHSPPVFVLFPWSTLTTQACLHRNATNLLQEDSKQGGSKEGQTGAVQLGPDGRHALGQVRPCCVHAAFINLSALCQPFHSRVCLYLLLKLRTHCPSTTSMQRDSYCCTCFMCRALLGALQPALLPCMVCTAQPPNNQPALAVHSHSWPTHGQHYCFCAAPPQPLACLIKPHMASFGWFDHPHCRLYLATAFPPHTGSGAQHLSASAHSVQPPPSHHPTAAGSGGRIPSRVPTRQWWCTCCAWCTSWLSMAWTCSSPFPTTYGTQVRGCAAVCFGVVLGGRGRAAVLVVGGWVNK